MRTVPALATPFGDEHLREIPLPDAPLVRVVAQLRFAEIASVVKREFIGAFQEAIREGYPILREERGLALVVGPEGVAQQSTEQIWRFHSADGQWRVSLAPTFVALETDRYGSRGDFLGRFETVISATATYLAPDFWDRLGVRYVDRIERPDALERLPELIRPEVLGFAADSQLVAASLETSLTQAQFAVAQDRQLVTRTGILPGGAVLDPSIPAASSRSWMLDIDMAIAGQFAFDAADVMSRSRELAAGVYRFFRWSVTADFLRVFGASEADLAEEGAT
jgi:uncharacterized protein (TIGR04255 family)